MTRNSHLDGLRSRGIAPQFYDPEGKKYGTPTYPFHWVPEGLMTRRQLRKANLAPGGHDPVAQILWKHHKQTRKAFLYDASLAVPKRVPTPAQLTAVQKALTARKICPACGQDKGYCIPKSLGECVDCHDEAEGVRHREPEYELEAG
jgi:hypothetical protein